MSLKKTRRGVQKNCLESGLLPIPYQTKNLQFLLFKNIDDFGSPVL